MRLVALGLWAGTACVGLYLLGTWLVRGGLRGQPAKVTRFPAFVIISHPVLALAGLGLWAGYTVTSRPGYCWAAFGAASASTLIGFALLTRWLSGISARHARAQPRRPGGWPVLLHGLAGMTTFALILVTATTMGHR